MIKFRPAREKPKMADQDSVVWYRGKRTRTGNSLGLRFDRALFRSHPEFSGEVRAHVIAPGKMLVVAEPEDAKRRSEDPVLRAFLSFLAQDMERNPRQIRPLDDHLVARIDSLVAGVKPNPDEDLGGELLLE